MGFDLYGMNPQADTPCPEWTKGEPFREVEGEDKHKKYEVIPELKKEYDKYINAKWKWQEENDGAYFRNNVWFWRPLWTYVSSVCYDILSVKDIERGSWNDGHKISKTKADKMAKKLYGLIEGGDVKAYESAYIRHQYEKGNWDKSYPFSEENVQRFADFCANSGGFRIC